MQKEATTKPAEACPRCGEPLEPVHINAGAVGLIVYHGEPPEGVLAQLAEVFTGSLVRDESGMPVLMGFKQGYKWPGLHCKRCRQITLSYTP